MVTKYFNIHNLVKIRIGTAIRSKVDIAMKHFRHFEVDTIEDDSVDLMIYDYSECPAVEHGAIASGTSYADNYLNIADERLCLNLIDRPLVVYCNRYAIPLKFLVQTVLFRKGWSLIHSAAIQYRGKNYLFPAFGGVGKTILASALIRAGGKLFGDDMVILSKEGLRSFPLDFSIYPYHVRALGIEDARVRRSLARIKALNWCAGVFAGMTSPFRRCDPRADKLLTVIIRFISTRFVSVSPMHLFGEGCVAQGGPLHSAYYLSRVGGASSDITVERVDAAVLAEICANIMFQEWHQSMSILYRYSGLSSFSLHTMFDGIKSVCQEAFDHVQCFRVMIPEKLDNPAWQSQLMMRLAAHSSAGTAEGFDG